MLARGSRWQTLKFESQQNLLRLKWQGVQSLTLVPFGAVHGQCCLQCTAEMAVAEKFCHWSFATLGMAEAMQEPKKSLLLFRTYTVRIPFSVIYRKVDTSVRAGGSQVCVQLGLCGQVMFQQQKLFFKTTDECLLVCQARERHSELGGWGDRCFVSATQLYADQHLVKGKKQKGGETRPEVSVLLDWQSSALLMLQPFNSFPCGGEPQP